VTTLVRPRPGRRLPIQRFRTVVIALVALAVCAVPALAAGGKVNVPATLSKLIPKATAKSGLPVLLPSSLTVDGYSPKRVVGSGSATRKGYDLELGVGKNCNGANACFVAAFFGTRGAKPSYKRTVSLTRGITGYFKPLTCGASCAPAIVQWQQHGALYEIQFKGASAKGEKATMIALANSAIRGGAR
jgi:hypothetical protein